MKRLASSIILCSLLLLCACESAVEDYSGDDDGTLLVNLDISVALSDVLGALTRAPEYADEVLDNEKMRSLRVVIMRPDWTVEANRLINLAAAVEKHSEMEHFPVVANETKRIYLFVNEGTKVRSKLTGIERKLLDFDLSSIKEGYYFPVNAIEGLKIRLEDDKEQIDGLLPMSERHEYHVTEKEEQSCTLFVTRAAVKFTFHIINNCGSDLTLGGLKINKMAREEWYMPRVEYSERDEGTGQREITGYEVPPGVGYYTYVMSVPEGGVKVKGDGGESVLSPVYLLEGKHIDEKDERNYSLEITVNGVTRKHYFPELKTLPRNTHVVVRITCGEDNVTCEVDVIPYSEVVLKPGFGLEEKKD